MLKIPKGSAPTLDPVDVRMLSLDEFSTVMPSWERTEARFDAADLLDALDSVDSAFDDEGTDGAE